MLAPGRQQGESNTPRRLIPAPRSVTFPRSLFPRLHPMPISFADAIFWLGVASCAIAQIAILRSVLRTRRARETGPGVPAPRFAVEVAWAVVPAIALAMLLVATWRTMHPVSPATGPTATRVVGMADPIPLSPTPGSGIR